ncbi:MAG: putative metal-dependent phosphoesterase [Erysipelotrichaceae bacterium]|nr:MAG: putative metal-dependent phosphoesterase [Erysipelotrichaceae bacterium]
MKHNLIDLHLHTNVSNDGQYSPSQLIDMCVESGLRIVAIADHNSSKAYHEALEIIHQKHLNLTLIPAIELDCQFNGINLHILGYGFNPNETWFTEYGKGLENIERLHSQTKVDKICSLGIHLKKEELEKISINGILTGEMIAEVALNDPRNEHHPLLNPYRTNGNRQDNPYVNFYWDYMAQGKFAYVEVNYVSAKEAIQHIKDGGGLAVFAHPGNNIGLNEKLLDEIVALGLDGLEVYSSYHDDKTTLFYQQKALYYHLLLTLGSDFHGKTKPSIKLGNFDCPDEENLTVAFLNRPEISKVIDL